jgi:hypothetical protein
MININNISVTISKYNENNGMAAAKANIISSVIMKAAIIESKENGENISNECQ